MKSAKLPSITLPDPITKVIGLVWRSCRKALAPVTPFGFTVLAVGVASWIIGARLDWEEFASVAAGCALALLIAAIFMLGKDRIAVSIELQPPRLVVGDTAAGRVVARNETGRRVLPFRLEAPVGRGLVRSDVPSLANGAEHEELFLVPTDKRSVIPVGPVSSVRGDPLGLMRREVAWTHRIDLYVHPKTIALAGLASGWIRDLEGMATNDLSPSDVAFHTLREYVPGDDRRHVHWRTSARIGTLMVRQFVDTRRSHLGIVVDCARDRYASDAEFELAMSVAGSLGLRALGDGQALSCVTGARQLACYNGDGFLDGLAGVEFGEGESSLATTVMEAVHAVAGASVVALITGSQASIPDLRLAAQWFPENLRVLSMRVAAGGISSYRPAGNTTVLDIAEIESLQRLLRVAGGL